MRIPSVTPAPSAKPAETQAALKKAADGFEEMLLVFLLRAARAGGVGDAVAGSEAVNATRDMLDAHLARTGASQSHLGIAEAVVRQFSPDYRRG